MSNIVDLLGRTFTPPSAPTPEPPERQLIDAIAEAGLTPPDNVAIDGRLHRFSSDGRPRDDSGWYVAFPGPIVAGQFGCWRAGLTVPFRADIGRDLTMPEQMALTRQMSEAKAARDKEASAKRESAADTARAIWDGATLASDDHPYLLAKGVSNPGLRVTGDGRLIAPLYIGGELVSLQFIDAQGGKKYLPGGKAGGASWTLAGGPVTYVCEGVATAASIFEATGGTVIVAYSAGNLPAVAPAGSVVVADNDPAGIREANKCAGCRVVVVPDGDANDYARSGGDLAALLAPPKASGWLVPADDFAGQPAPLRWLVKGWLPREGLGMLHGPSGGGKTFVVLDWACRIASSLGEWCGANVKPGPVVYLAGEGHHGLKGRVAAWKQHHGVARLDMWISTAGADLNTPSGYLYANEAIQSLPSSPCLIVVDTLHRHYVGNENDPQDVKTMLDACAALQRDYQAAVLLIHHTGVSDEAQHRGRGSSAWRGALETEISVVPGTDGGPIEVISRKSKDSAEPASKYLTITTVPLPWVDEDGEAVTSAVVVEADAPVSEASESRALSTARQLIEASIIKYGYRLSESAFFISAGAIREYALTHGSYPSDGARRQAVSEAKKRMLEAGKMHEHSDGYAITDPMIVSALAVLMQVKK